MTENNNVLLHELQILKGLASAEEVTLGKVIEILAGKGHAILIILFCLPFCQPIQIPGFSTPFGLLIALIGMRIAFGHSPWLPQWILNKKISSHTLNKILDVGIKVAKGLKKFLKTRQTWLIHTPTFHIAHGLTIAVLGILLALPLPIPLSNLLAGWPLLAFGLGLLEEDGIAIIVAYVLAGIALIVFGGLFWFGRAGLFYLLGWS